MNRKFITALFVMISALVFSITVQAADYKTPAQLVKEAKAAIKEVSVDDLKKMLDNKENVIVLDVRDRDEYEKQRIPGAIHMSRGLVDLHIEELIPDKNATIVVYWIFDKRAPLATKSLNELGYVNTVNLNGGMKAWMDAGNPVEKNKKGFSMADKYWSFYSSADSTFWEETLI